MESKRPQVFLGSDIETITHYGLITIGKKRPYKNTTPGDGSTWRRKSTLQSLVAYHTGHPGDLLGIALRRRALVDRKIKTDAAITVNGPEVSVLDNASLAGAAKQALEAFGDLHDRGLIDDRELLRICYRFAGETLDMGENLAQVENRSRP